MSRYLKSSSLKSFQLLTFDYKPMPDIQISLDYEQQILLLLEQCQLTVELHSVISLGEVCVVPQYWRRLQWRIRCLWRTDIIIVISSVWSASNIPLLPQHCGQEQEPLEYQVTRHSSSSPTVSASSSHISSPAPLSAPVSPHHLGDSPGDRGQTPLHGGQVGQVSGSFSNSFFIGSGQ